MLPAAFLLARVMADEAANGGKGVELANAVEGLVVAALLDEVNVLARFGAHRTRRAAGRATVHDLFFNGQSGQAKFSCLSAQRNGSKKIWRPRSRGTAIGPCATLYNDTRRHLWCQWLLRDLTIQSRKGRLRIAQRFIAGKQCAVHSQSRKGRLKVISH
jgi:hypothetical protein